MLQSFINMQLKMQDQKHHYNHPNYQTTVLSTNLQQQSGQSSSQSIEASQSDSQSQNPQLDSEQLQKALKTLKKLKKIAKNKKLTELKTNDKKVNNIFKSMSYFFQYRSQQTQKKKIEAKRLKQSRKQALKAVGIRNRLHLSQDQNSNQSSQVIQNFSSELKSSNVQINAQKCYICKNRYTEIHHFYDCLCVNCGDFNFKKRNQTADLSGMLALVTGARIKIGFQIALKLLRDGATVIATTRFWKDAFLRYQKESDYEQWAQRLFLIQCDFTSSPQVAQLIQLVKEKFQKLDILINNAAQTIVKPKEFYLKEIVNQTRQIPQLPAHLADFQPKYLSNLVNRYPSLYLPENPSTLLQLQNNEDSPLRQIQKLEQTQASNNEIDQQIRDEFDQPLDKRQKNSWVQKIDDVSLVDCYSTQLVNSIVPFHLISQLKPLMKKTVDQTPSFIINVSSMEGIFYRPNKQSTHPHTNMAKAALNMITRTSAYEFASDNIYMNSVDTGWVTEENPFSYKTQRLIPLDCVDGAMRVLDPVYLGFREKVFLCGKFIKDYRESSW